MTNKEAITVLKMVDAHGLADEAKQMAIKALEKEKEGIVLPNGRGDLISKQEISDYVKSYIHEIISESGRDLNEHTNRVLRSIIEHLNEAEAVVEADKEGAET